MVISNIEKNLEEPVHPAHRQQATWFYNESLETLAICSGYNPENHLEPDLRRLSSLNNNLAGLALVEACDPDRVRKHLRHAHHLGMLKSKQQRLEPGQSIELTMDDRRYSLARDARYDVETDSDLWEFLFWSCLILDDEQGLEYLSMLYHCGGIVFERAGDGPWLDLLMTLFGATELPVSGTIQAYVDASSPQRLSHDAFAYAVGVRLPALDLMLKIFGKAAEGEYQRSLSRALAHHHDYWSHRTSDHEFLSFPGDYKGDNAWPLVALARVARRRSGYQPRVECDYLPPCFYLDEPAPLDLTGFAPLQPKPGDKPDPYAASR